MFFEGTCQRFSYSFEYSFNLWHMSSKKHDVTFVNKPFTTLQQQFPALKFRPSMESQTNVMYKIPCTNCSWCYIGETGRAFNTQKKNIWETPILRRKVLELLITPGPTTAPTDFESAPIIDKGTFSTRKTRYLVNTTFFFTNIHN